jgi:DNA-binding response OmpR family regulator
MSAERRIVIADDEASIRRLVAAGLAGTGRRIVWAADGDGAWAAVERERPHVALLDVQMPGRTGVELTRLIRATAALAGTRVVLLSAKAQAADVALGVEAGANQYITKPFSVVELMAVVERELASLQEEDA